MLTTNSLLFASLCDSYTDSCNSYRLLYKNVSHPLFPACNPPPIGRAVGGPEWPEYIVSDQQQANKPVAKRASSEPWKVVNFAYSGATCDNVNFPRPVLEWVSSATLAWRVHVQVAGLMT